MNGYKWEFIKGAYVWSYWCDKGLKEYNRVKIETYGA